MAFSVLGSNTMLDALGAQALYASVHSAPPTDAGLFELTGGSPAYARQPVTWSPAALATLPIAAPLLFDIPAASTTCFVGLWTLLTGGVFLGASPTSMSDVYGAATASNATTGTGLATCPNHGLAANDAVILTPVGGGTMPNPFVIDTLYYVVADPTTSTFQLSIRKGEFAQNFTTDGRFAFQRVGIDSFSVQGTLTISSLHFSLES